jgi:hypothetical protein
MINVAMDIVENNNQPQEI